MWHVGLIINVRRKAHRRIIISITRCTIDVCGLSVCMQDGFNDICCYMLFLLRRLVLGIFAHRKG